MSKTYHYICKLCKGADIKPCILMVNLSPGLPSKCPFNLGFTSKLDGWKEVSKEEYQKAVNAF